MEILQIQSIIEHLIHVSFIDPCFADLKFEAENDALIKQHNVDPLSEPRDIILEYDTTVLINEPGQGIPHYGDFTLPRFSCRRLRVTVIIVAQQPKDRRFRLLEKTGETVIV